MSKPTALLTNCGSENEDAPGTVLPFPVISCMHTFITSLSFHSILSVTHIHTLAISTPFDLNALNCGTLESWSTINQFLFNNNISDYWLLGHWTEIHCSYWPFLPKWKNLQWPKLAAWKLDLVCKMCWPAMQDASGWPSGLCHLQWNLPH